VSRAKNTNEHDQPPWAALGARLRDIRQERRMSLASVSKETGISPSFLSLLEKGETDVSLGRLLPLLRFYGLSVAEVLDAASDADVVVRSGEAPYLFSVARGIDAYLAAPDRRGPFLPVILEYAPGSAVRDYSSHDGHEFLYVLDGGLRVEFQDGTSFALAPGDGMYFSSQRPHRTGVDGDDGARVLVVTTERVHGT
jgi:transcriptional regulator with XRE-family HTH domain